MSANVKTLNVLVILSLAHKGWIYGKGFLPWESGEASKAVFLAVPLGSIGGFVVPTFTGNPQELGTLLTLETFDQSDKQTWPDQQKDKDNDKGETIYKTSSKSDPNDLEPSNFWSFVKIYNNFDNGEQRS